MTLSIVDLRCEGRALPLGLDQPAPCLSWHLHGSRRQARLTACRVRVATTEDALAAGRADLWDSGWLQEPQALSLLYAGRPLASRQRAWWTVEGRDETGAGVSPDAPAWFEMGLLDRQDWQATWIAAPWSGDHDHSAPCPHLRRAFVLDRPVVQARLYLAALGLVEASLNGEPVSDIVLAPGWTDFRQRVRYLTCDVGRLLREGTNVLGALLGDGWYCGHLEKRRRQLYGEKPLLIARLEITHPEGPPTVVVSGADWRSGRGPILGGDLIMGEVHDQRRRIDGWDGPDFDAAAWDRVVVVADPGVRLESPRGPMPRRQEVLPAVTNPELSPDGEWVYDLGQNLAGRVRLDLDLPAGATVRLRHAEMREADGRLHLANLRTARATDTITSDGRPFTWEPRFTHHGFRHVGISGLTQPLPRSAVSGVVVHSDLERIGTFRCSHPLLNRLHENIVWGLKGNFLDVPTDCPQRDERLGWLGDAQVFAPTAAYLYDVGGFFAKWCQDLRDAQNPDGSVPCLVPNSHLPGAWPDGGPGWSDATVICPWAVYQATGDVRLLADHWQHMDRWMAWVQRDSRDHLRGEPYSSVQSFGDWCALDGSTGTKGGTSFLLIGTAYYAHVADLMARIAGVLGRDGDARRYGDLHQRIVAAFQARFLGPDGRLRETPTQTAYTLALRFGLVPEALRSSALDALEEDIRARGMRLSTGFLGTPHLLHVLSDGDRLDTAYALLTRKEHPSWLYPVTQGATTIWERWDGWTREHGFQNPGMNSFNHYAFGAVGEWLYRVVAGIAPLTAGYRRIRLAPRPGGSLAWAKAVIDTAAGRVSSHWSLADGRLWWEVTVPPQATATAVIPTGPAAGIREGGRRLNDAAGVQVIADHAQGVVLELAAGTYGFIVPWPAGTGSGMRSAAEMSSQTTAVS